MSEKNTEDYIWALQRAYNLLRSDIPTGALARLPVRTWSQWLFWKSAKCLRRTTFRGERRFTQERPMVMIPAETIKMQEQEEADRRAARVCEADKTYGDGFGAGYAQAIADADAALRARGDDQTARRGRQAVLALVEVPFDPREAMPRPDWTKYRVPAVRDYPKPRASTHSGGDRKNET